jgi:hypothetical protein
MFLALTTTSTNLDLPGHVHRPDAAVEARPVRRELLFGLGYLDLVLGHLPAGVLQLHAGVVVALYRAFEFRLEGLDLFLGIGLPLVY